MNLFELAQTTIPVAGSEQRFPVRRIYCIGRNYAKHVAEMGYDVERSRPFYFSKPADAIALPGEDVPYPPRTDNLHHEIELVVAIGKPGRDIPVNEALEHIFGYAVGIDLTRRDLQHAAKNGGQPWETAKGFDKSAPVSALHPAAVIGHPSSGRIWLAVNGETRQDGDLNEQVWNVQEGIAELSTLFELRAGDLIFTGTPDGVGPLMPGDRISGGIEGVDEITVAIA